MIIGIPKLLLGLVMAVARPHGLPTGIYSSINGMDRFFFAIATVESNCDDSVTADGGRSIGRYCIMRAYFVDSGVPGRYEQVRDKAYAERVMLGYWQRYCPQSLKNGDFETLARVHNCGATLWRRDRARAITATNGYWMKVKKKLK